MSERVSGRARSFPTEPLADQCDDRHREERRGSAHDRKHEHDKLFQQFERYFPDLAKLVVFRELATPFSTEAITGHYEGAFYGLDITPKRALSDALRMKTPFEDLYLAGQDVVSPGVMGAMWGGLLAAACVDRKVLAHMRG